MDDYSQGRDTTTEYGMISIDDILSEYQEEQRAAAALARYQAYLEDEDQNAPNKPAPAAVDSEGVKVYKPKSKLADTAQEAKDYIRELDSTPPQKETTPVRQAKYSPPEPDSGYAPEPDYGYAPETGEDPYAKYNLGGRTRSMYYGGGEADTSPDDDYIPPSQEAYIPSHWGSGDGEYAPEDFDGDKVKRRKVKGKGKKKKKKKPLNAPPNPDYQDEDDYAAEFRDYNVSGDHYAPGTDYAFDRDDEERSEKKEGGFPSFGQYIAGLFTGMLVRMRGPGSLGVTSTVNEDDEDLGQELKPAAASKYYGSHVHSLRLRFRISLGLLIIMCYITLGLPMSGMLRTIQVQAAVCLALQLAIMLMALDVVTGSAINLARGRFGADCLGVLGCLLTSIDALSVAVDGFGNAHMPLCLLTSLSLTGLLLSSLLSARGLRKALRVPAIGKRAYAVTCETGVKGMDMTLLKSVRPTTGFVRRTEEAPPDETAFLKAAPLLLIAALVLTLITCLTKKCFGDFLFVFTALLSPAVPVAALLCFALPFFVGSMRIFSSGAAIAGWSGLCDVGQSKNLIVTDRDLFPDGSAEFESIRIFADAPSEKIIAFAGSMITASGSSIAACFGDLMEKNGCTMRRVENFEYLAGGGMKGIIDGEVILCGNTDLMRLMNVRVPFRLVSKTTVLLAVDGLLYGIFNMTYTAEPQVRQALVSLVRSNRHPIFAIRDFNVTPEMLHLSFDVATDGYDFPPYVERYAISEAKPAEDSKISAVVCREGLGALTHLADTGRSMYVATRLNLLITLLAAALGMLSVFIKFLTVGAVGSGFLLVFMLLWALPVAVISVFLKF